MKTIRIKRPVDIPGATSPTTQNKPVGTTAAEPPKPVDTQAETKVAPSAAQPATTFTQRKTLKIARPGGGMVRPSGKFGVKKPASPTAAKPAAEPSSAGAVADIADIPDMPTVVSPVSPVAPLAPVVAGDTVPDVPKGVATLGLIVQFAACAAIGALAWMLFQNTQVLPF